MLVFGTKIKVYMISHDVNDKQTVFVDGIGVSMKRITMAKKCRLIKGADTAKGCINPPLV